MYKVQLFSTDNAVTAFELSELDASIVNDINNSHIEFPVSWSELCF